LAATIGQDWRVVTVVGELELELDFELELSLEVVLLVPESPSLVVLEPVVVLVELDAGCEVLAVVVTACVELPIEPVA
jgi:hypothetical protein